MTLGKRGSVQEEAARVLSSPIGQRTEWTVITGAPSSGKTTILESLATEGYRTNPDISRQYIESLLQEGEDDKAAARTNESLLQENILWKMIANAGSIPKDQRVLFDYALPDNIAFWELGGLAVRAEVWRSAALFRYKNVFLFERLPMVDDEVRTEDPQYQDQITKKLRCVYEALGYSPIWVPATTMSQRIAIIKSVIGLAPSERPA